MPPQPLDGTSPVVLSTSPVSRRTPPVWSAEALLLLARLDASPLAAAMASRLRLARGRMGTYEPIDFVLVLILFALSGVRTLEAFYVELAPFRALAAWKLRRRALPSRSALSRFLLAADTPLVDTLRNLLFEDLLHFGLRGDARGGMRDRRGETLLLFDLDGTRQTARLRALPHDEERPASTRRRTRSFAPGYTGRKRGELVRTRSVLQQAHTREWLDTRGAPGNGTPQADLAHALEALRRYAQAHALDPSTLLVRLDGLYGYSWVLRGFEQAGVGFLARSANYALLDRYLLLETLSRDAHATYTPNAGGPSSELFDLPAFPWTHDDGSEQPVRLLVLRRRLARGERPAVGKVRGDFVYELFVTDRSVASLRATDVLGLYFARAGAENALAHEDQEIDADRCCSNHGPGQELWQLLSQWVSNVRLQLGHAANDGPPRVIEWAAALPTEEQAAPAEASRGQVCEASGRGKGKYGPEAFTWCGPEALRCPAGATLRPVETRGAGRSLRVLYGASRRDCAGCAHAILCRGANASAALGRRVSVRIDEPSTAPSRPSAALWWVDVPARALRRVLFGTLRGERVEYESPPPIPPAPRRVARRAHREHRRLDWAERFARNALPPATPPWHAIAHGVPQRLRDFLQSLCGERAVA